ncbi:MAG: MFS transporter [Elusimicrobia bacterium]|nr:MFS transporter [Elusimicrobiota bacterium]
MLESLKPTYKEIKREKEFEDMINSDILSNSDIWNAVIRHKDNPRRALRRWKNGFKEIRKHPEFDDITDRDVWYVVKGHKYPLKLLWRLKVQYDAIIKEKEFENMSNSDIWDTVIRDKYPRGALRRWQNGFEEIRKHSEFDDIIDRDVFFITKGNKDPYEMLEKYEEIKSEKEFEDMINSGIINNSDIWSAVISGKDPREYLRDKMIVDGVRKKPQSLGEKPEVVVARAAFKNPLSECAQIIAEALGIKSEITEAFKTVDDLIAKLTELSVKIGSKIQEAHESLYEDERYMVTGKKLKPYKKNIKLIKKLLKKQGFPGFKVVISENQNLVPPEGDAYSLATFNADKKKIMVHTAFLDRAPPTPRLQRAGPPEMIEALVAHELGEDNALKGNDPGFEKYISDLSVESQKPIETCRNQGTYHQYLKSIKQQESLLNYSEEIANAERNITKRQKLSYNLADKLVGGENNVYYKLLKSLGKEDLMRQRLVDFSNSTIDGIPSVQALKKLAEDEHFEVKNILSVGSFTRYPRFNDIDITIIVKGHHKDEFFKKIPVLMNGIKYEVSIVIAGEDNFEDEVWSTRYMYDKAAILYGDNTFDSVRPSKDAQRKALELTKKDASVQTGEKLIHRTIAVNLIQYDLEGKKKYLKNAQNLWKTLEQNKKVEPVNAVSLGENIPKEGMQIRLSRASGITFSILTLGAIAGVVLVSVLGSIVAVNLLFASLVPGIYMLVFLVIVGMIKWMSKTVPERAGPYKLIGPLKTSAVEDPSNEVSFMEVRNIKGTPKIVVNSKVYKLLTRMHPIAQWIILLFSGILLHELLHMLGKREFFAYFTAQVLSGLAYSALFCIAAIVPAFFVYALVIFIITSGLFSFYAVYKADLKFNRKGERIRLYTKRILSRRDYYEKINDIHFGLFGHSYEFRHYDLRNHIHRWQQFKKTLKENWIALKNKWRVLMQLNEYLAYRKYSKRFIKNNWEMDREAEENRNHSMISDKFNKSKQ